MMCCCLKCTLSSVPSGKKSRLLPHILRLRQKPVNFQLPQEVNELTPFQLPDLSSNDNEHGINSPRRSLGTSSTSTLLHSNYILIQTGLCSSVTCSVINCENILTAEGCRTYVQSQGGTLVKFEDVTSSHPSGCFTFSATDDNEWYFNQAKLSTNIARQEDETRYRFVCDCRQQSPLLAKATSTSSSTQDNLEMNSRGLTEMRMVTNRRRLAACLSISTSGWNEWSASCSDTRFELAGVDSNNGATFLTKDDVVSQNESMSFDETPRLALLSTPPLEEEDERTTHVVLSFGSVVLRWNHSNCWKRRAGKLKSISSLSYYIFRRQSSHIT